MLNGKCKEAKMGREACAASWDWQTGARRQSAVREVANADESGLVVEALLGEVLGQNPSQEKPTRERNCQGRETSLFL